MAFLTDGPIASMSNDTLKCALVVKHKDRTQVAYFETDQEAWAYSYQLPRGAVVTIYHNIHKYVLSILETPPGGPTQTQWCNILNELVKIPMIKYLIKVRPPLGCYVVGLLDHVETVATLADAVSLIHDTYEKAPRLPMLFSRVEYRVDPASDTRDYSKNPFWHKCPTPYLCISVEYSGRVSCDWYDYDVDDGSNEYSPSAGITRSDVYKFILPFEEGWKWVDEWKKLCPI